MEHQPEHEDGLAAFRQDARQAMGNDEHAQRLDFAELDEVDEVLYQLFIAGILTIDRIKQGVHDASAAGHRSSALFRGWLANKVTVQILRAGMKKQS